MIYVQMAVQSTTVGSTPRKGQLNDQSTLPDPEYLLKLLNMKMPFGKYKGRLLIDLPETYLCWFERKGFPEGTMGMMLKSVYEIKLNGLEGMLKPLRNK